MKTIIKVVINLILIAIITGLFNISIASFLFWIIYLPLAVYQSMVVDRIFAKLNQKKVLKDFAMTK